MSSMRKMEVVSKPERDVDAREPLLVRLEDNQMQIFRFDIVAFAFPFATTSWQISATFLFWRSGQGRILKIFQLDVRISGHGSLHVGWCKAMPSMF